MDGFDIQFLLVPLFNTLLLIIGALIVKKYLENLLFSKNNECLYINKKMLEETIETHKKLCQESNICILEKRLNYLENRLNIIEEDLKELSTVIIDVRERLIRLETLLNGRD